jgi:alkanesulfonate monooxygenase SsuD/methylene tetrahydromethanopterin reductase-like flavin-dependent oxidoreductase (luciferase family)
LSVLDLSPVTEGSTPAQALRNTLDLARHAEEAGYLRYWVAEHHLVEGVASSAPAVLIGAIASVTSRIRVGSGAVQLGHQTALAVVEAFGTLSGLYPGRIDLGLGRSGQRRKEAARELAAQEATGSPSAGSPPAGRPGSGQPAGPRVVSGLLIPAKFSPAALYTSPRFALQDALLRQPGAEVPDFTAQVNDIQAFLAGTWRSAESGIALEAVPGTGADAQVWILGSSAGQSAQVAGALGLPFAANYHVSPATILDAVAAYRDAFIPGVLARPHVMVSADVVVAPSDARACELAAGYGLWVRSVRSGGGAMRYPSAASAAAAHWSEQDAALVEDRVATQFAGSPETVAASLLILQDATGADELLVTTITHDHADRVRSLRLLAREWGLC